MERTIVSFAFLAMLFNSHHGAARESSAVAQAVFGKAERCVVVVEGFLRGERKVRGSGVVAWSKSASEPSRHPRGMSVVYSNAHVVGAHNNAVVAIHRGNRYEGRVVFSDSELDLAAFEVPNVSLPACISRSAADVAIGERVFAIGSPMGLENSISDGIVSGKRSLGGLNLIQFTAPIASGSSGGGLFDVNGKLLGITTFKIKGGENLNFAIDSYYITLVERARDAAAFVITFVAGGGSKEELDRHIDNRQGPLALWLLSRWRTENVNLIDDIHTYWRKLEASPKDDKRIFDEVSSFAARTYDAFLNATPRDTAVAAAAHGSDARWLPVGVPGATWLLDRESVRRESHLLFVTVVRNNTRPHIERAPNEPASVVSRYVIDCSARTEALIGGGFYTELFGGGRGTLQSALSRDRWQFRVIEGSETLIGQVYGLVCN